MMSRSQPLCASLQLFFICTSWCCQNKWNVTSSILLAKSANPQLLLTNRRAVCISAQKPHNEAVKHDPKLYIMDVAVARIYGHIPKKVLKCPFTLQRAALVSIGSSSGATETYDSRTQHRLTSFFVFCIYGHCTRAVLVSTLHSY